jgi:hypothetical protein
MRRFYLLAIAAMSAYCLTDAFASIGGEPVRRPGTPTFSADIANLPVIDKYETVGLDHSGAQTQSPAERVSEQQALPSAPAAALPAPSKTRTAAAAPHVKRHHTSKVTTTSDELAALAFVTPTWEPPIRVAQHSSIVGGCSGAKWSQPDAAGVPVLVCN